MGEALAKSGINSSWRLSKRSWECPGHTERMADKRQKQGQQDMVIKPEKFARDVQR